MKRILVLFTTLLSTLAIFVSDSLSEGEISQKIYDFSQPRKVLTSIYDPSGKPDPFRPIFSDGFNKAAPTILQSDCISNPVLEKLSLSQLQLTGIVLTKRQPIALVQESNSKGHILTKDTCIGVNGGKVAEIMNDRIIIQTKIRDVFKNVKVKKTEMKLKKSAN